MDYMIRVELHGASYAHYEKLHAALAAKRVTNVIAGSTGAKYKLPPAEYVYTGTETIEQVRDAVYRVAAQVLANPAVVVTERGACAWQGLQAA
jgi:hypothetical protein